MPITTELSLRSIYSQHTYLSFTHIHDPKSPTPSILLLLQPLIYYSLCCLFKLFTITTFTFIPLFILIVFTNNHSYLPMFHSCNNDRVAAIIGQLIFLCSLGSIILILLGRRLATTI